MVRLHSEFKVTQVAFLGTIVDFTFTYISGTFVTKRGMGFNSGTYLPALHELYTTVCAVSILQLTNSLCGVYGEIFVGLLI